MNTIPEGKELIWAEAVYKEPIEGIPFSNIGLTVGISQYMNQDEPLKKDESIVVLDKLTERLVKRYFDRLSKDIRNTRNEMIDKLRIELAEEKDEVIKKARDEYKKLKEENKKLKLIIKKNGQ